MPDACDEMAVGCCGSGSIAGIVIDDCGSAICTASALLKFFHIPLNFDASLCPRFDAVYTTMRESFDYQVQNGSADLGDFCYREDGGFSTWGHEDTIFTPDPYCEPMGTVRTTYGDQLLANCANLTFDPGGGLTDDIKDATSWYRRWVYTANSGQDTFITEQTIQLSGEIDLNALLAEIIGLSSAGLEDGFDKGIVLGCAGVPATTKVPVGELNLPGRSASAYFTPDAGATRVSFLATSIKGLAARPYKLRETTTSYCPTSESVACEDFPKDAGRLTAQVDCVTIVPAPNTLVSVTFGLC